MAVLLFFAGNNLFQAPDRIWCCYSAVVNFVINGRGSWDGFIITQILLPSTTDDSPVPECSVQFALLPLLLNSSLSRIPEVSPGRLDVGLHSGLSTVSNAAGRTLEGVLAGIWICDVVHRLESHSELGSGLWPGFLWHRHAREDLIWT